MRAIKIFGYFLFLMIIKCFRLSDDVDRNYKIAKEISRRTLKSAGITVESIGNENIPESSATVIIPNHKSLFDIMALILIVDRTMGAVAAKEMYIPFLRRYIDAIKSVKLDRFINGSVDKREVVQTQRKIIETLKSGHCLTIFPEGRLIHDKDFGEFKNASFNAPLKTDAYIVPTYIHGSEGINRKGRWFKFPKAHITITFDKPIKPSEAGIKTTSELSQTTKGKIVEMRNRFDSQP